MTRFHLSQEKIGPVPGLNALGIGVEFYPRFKPRGISLHTHDFVELAYITGGFGQHLLEDKTAPAKPGSLVIAHYHQAHGFQTEKGLDILNLYLDPTKHPLPSLASPLDKILYQILPIHAPFGKGLRRLIHLQFEEVEPLAGLLFSLKKELESDKIGMAGAAENYLSLILTACCRQYQLFRKRHRIKTSPPSAAPAAARIERLREHLDEHFAAETRLSHLAAQAQLEPHYLCRAFKARTGKPVFVYLLHRRLEYSLWLLRHSNKRITEIALASGFSDLPHFNRIFKREIGLSPREYRRQWI